MKCNNCGFKFSLEYSRIQSLDHKFDFDVVLCPICTARVHDLKLEERIVKDQLKRID
jgi:hypothetical protein